jgi:hypothetical protein
VRAWPWWKYQMYVEQLADHLGLKPAPVPDDLSDTDLSPQASSFAAMGFNVRKG